MTKQSTSASYRDRPLRLALRSNALFSGTSGLLLLVAAGPLSAATGLSPVLLLRAVGGGLLLFAAGLWLNAGRPTLDRGQVRAAVVMDLGWVAGTALLLVFGSGWTGLGFWALIGVAEIVLGFALWQAFALKRLGESPPGLGAAA